MRIFALLLAAGFASAVLRAEDPAAQTAAPQTEANAGASAGQTPPFRNIGTMSELMVRLIYPTSDAVFYIQTRTPTNEIEWNELQAKTLTLAESANLMMLPGRARDQGQWMSDTKLLLDAGVAAFKAAKNRDVPALVALNDQLLMSCTSCHMHYRPNFRRQPAAPPPAQ